MNTYWDIVGSIIISSLFMMTLFIFHNSLSRERNMSNLWTITQENAKVLSDVIEYDFRKIGYGTAPGTCPFISADSTSIAFYSDLNNDGKKEIVAAKKEGIYLWTYNGTNMGIATRTEIPASGYEADSPPVLADINMDGFLDVVFIAKQTGTTNARVMVLNLQTTPASFLTNWYLVGANNSIIVSSIGNNISSVTLSSPASKSARE